MHVVHQLCELLPCRRSDGYGRILLGPVTIGHALKRRVYEDGAALKRNLETMLNCFRAEGISPSSPMVRKMDLISESGLVSVDWTHSSAAPATRSAKST